jgi:phosphatidylglycerol:prolipoprotein diacylglycerol transferase
MPEPLHVAISLLLAIGGYIYWRRFYRADPLPAALAAATIALLVILSLLGGRLAYALAHGLDWTGAGAFLGSLLTAQGWRAGYLSIGVMTGAGLAVLLSALIFRYPFFKLADVFSPAIFIAFAIWRIGCFAHGCCYGVPTNLPWAVRFTLVEELGIHTAPVHPIQLYEAAFCLSVFLMLPLILRRMRAHHAAGLATTFCLMIYAAWRLLIDFLRAPATTQYAGALTLAQWAALLLLALGGASLCYFNRRARQNSEVAP